MKTLCLFKLIRLPEDVNQLASITDLLKKDFSLSSLEAYGQPVYEDDPEYELLSKFILETETYKATASIIFMDSMLSLQLIVSMKGRAYAEPFVDCLEWDSIQRFEGVDNGQVASA